MAPARPRASGPRGGEGGRGDDAPPGCCSQADTSAATTAGAPPAARRQAPRALVLALFAVMLACALAGALPAAEATGRSLSASPASASASASASAPATRLPRSSSSNSSNSSKKKSSSSHHGSRRRDEEGHRRGSSTTAVVDDAEDNATAAADNLRLPAPGLRIGGAGGLPGLLPPRQLASPPSSRPLVGGAHGQKEQQTPQQQEEQAAKLAAQRAQTAALLPAGTPQWATNLIRADVASWSEQMSDLVLPHGYPLQVFNLTTRDGYVLTVHRIPYGRSPVPPPLEVWPSGMDPSGAAAQLFSAYQAMKQGIFSVAGNVTSLLTGGWLTLESGVKELNANATTAAAPQVAAALVAPPLPEAGKAAAAATAATTTTTSPPAAAPALKTKKPAAAVVDNTASDGASSPSAPVRTLTIVAGAGGGGGAGGLLEQAGEKVATAGGKVVSAGGKVVDWGAQAGAKVLRPVTATLHKVAGVAAAGMDAAEGVLVGKAAGKAGAASKAAAAAAAGGKTTAAQQKPKPPTPKPIAMLIHGLSVSSAGWVVLGPSDSLAFKLADAGYDVWMPNTRGSLYSQRHVSLQPNEKAFWAYSLDEQAVVDLPAFIDLALEVTGAPSVTLLGHSQGGILEIMTLAARPEYNDKVDLALGLAPVYFPSMIATPLIRFMLNLEMYKLLGILTAAGVQDVVPNWMIGRLLGAPQCSSGLLVESVGPPCLSLIHTSLAGKYGFISPADFDAISRTWPASVGLRNLLHWVEIAKEPSKTNAIVPWPCGDDCAKCADSPVALASCRAREAMKKRGVSGNGTAQLSSSSSSSRIPTPVIPSEYNLSAITTKVAVLGGDMDLLAPPESYRLLKERLPKGSFVEYDASAQAGHMDITWGRGAPWYAPTVAMMRKHTRGVPQPGVMGGVGLGAMSKVAGEGGWTAVGGPVVIRDKAAVEAALDGGGRQAAAAPSASGARVAAASSGKGKDKKRRGGWFGGLFGGGGVGGLFGLGRRD